MAKKAKANGNSGDNGEITSDQLHDHLSNTRAADKATKDLRDSLIVEGDALCKDYGINKDAFATIKRLFKKDPQNRSAFLRSFDMLREKAGFDDQMDFFDKRAEDGEPADAMH